jgi:hypothetical protein
MATFNLETYVPVHERLQQFYEKHPDGRIATQIIEHDRENGFVLIKATAYKSLSDEKPAATGHAFEERGQGYINKTSYVENCETSAIGRCLAAMGFCIDKGIASRQEMEKVQRMSEAAAEAPAFRVNGNGTVKNRSLSSDGSIVLDAEACSCSAFGHLGMCGHIGKAAIVAA